MTLFGDIVSVVEELCYRHEHIEPYHTWSKSRNKIWNQHRTMQDPLLDQLADMIAVKGQPGKDDVFVASKDFESKPPCNIEALSRAVDIQRAVSMWAARLGVPEYPTTKQTLMSFMGNRLVGLPEQVQVKLLADCRRWRVWCAVVNNWDQAIWSPHVRCPVRSCGQLGGLRVVFSQHSAYCAECGATWDGPDAIRDLADAVQGNQGDDLEVPVIDVDSLPEVDLSFLA